MNALSGLQKSCQFNILQDHVGLSATWDVTKNVSLTGGVDNLFDKRLWRAGNAQTTGDLAGANYIAGAGAYTYNEPGRTWYMSINMHF